MSYGHLVVLRVLETHQKQEFHVYWASVGFDLIDDLALRVDRLASTEHQTPPTRLFICQSTGLRRSAGRPLVFYRN